MNDEAKGTWDQERLWVLRTLDEVKSDQKKMAEAAAADRASLIDKGARDIKAAHDKIRALESTGATMTIKNWLMTIALSGVVTILIELGREFLRRWKP